MQTFALGLALVVAGLLGVFWGYRIFRILLPIYGGVAGFVIAFNWMGQNTTLLAVVVGIVLAIVLALLAFFLWSVLFAIAGALLGIVLTAIIASALNLSTWLAALIAVILSLLFAWLFWKFRNPMIIIGTVLVGAAAVAEGVGAWFGLKTGMAVRLQPNPVWLLLLLAVVWVTMVGVGIVFQWPRYRQMSLWGFGKLIEPSTQPESGAMAEPAANEEAAGRGTEGQVGAGATRAATAVPDAAAAVVVGVAAAAEKGAEPVASEVGEVGEGAAVPVAAAVATAGMAAGAGQGAGATATSVSAGAEEGVAAPVAAVVGAAADVVTESGEEPEIAAEGQEAMEEQAAYVVAQIESRLSLGEMAIFKRKLDYVEGIGPVYAGKLREIGVMTVLDLLQQGTTRKGRARLAERSGITGTLILKWVNHTDLYRIKGVGAEYADLLEAAGVDTVVELGHRNPANLLQKMLDINEAKHLVRKTPVLSQVTDWIVQAKGLPRIVQY
jgi:predicted flap endonuclease-1-like 5' DNA nuclease